MPASATFRPSQCTNSSSRTGSRRTTHRPSSRSLLNTAPEFAVTHPTAIQAICRALARRQAMVLLHDEAEPAGLGKVVAFDERLGRMALELPGTLSNALVRASHMIADLDGIQIVLPLWTTQTVTTAVAPATLAASSLGPDHAKAPAYAAPRRWLTWLRGGPQTPPARGLHTVHPHTNVGDPAHTQWLNLPAKLWRVQRREGFRLAIRDDERLVIEPQMTPRRPTCSTQTALAPAWPDKAQVLDISVRGLAWLAANGQVPPEVGDRCDRVLMDLPDSGVVVVDLQVKRVEASYRTRTVPGLNTAADPRTGLGWRVACAYVDISEPMERRIQHWLLQTERARRRVGT